MLGYILFTKGMNAMLCTVTLGTNAMLYTVSIGFNDVLYNVAIHIRLLPTHISRRPQGHLINV